MLTRPIPKSAIPVVTIIREYVHPPSRPPEQIFLGEESFPVRLRWAKFRFENPKHECEGNFDPMGLLPDTRFPQPCRPEHFHTKYKLSATAIWAFGHWWDEQHDGEEAMKAVWKKELR